MMIISNIMKMGCFPQRPGPSNLIWNASSGALYAASSSYTHGYSTNMSLQVFRWFPGFDAFQAQRKLG